MIKAQLEAETHHELPSFLQSEVCSVIFFLLVKFRIRKKYLGTCFALWKDTIDNLSNYKVSGPAFHTMCLSIGKINLPFTF